MIFGHKPSTAYTNYLETKEQERRAGNEKRSKYMQEELGLEQPQEYRVLDPPLQAENDRPSILSGVDQSLVCEKLDQLKYNPICTKRRNDVLAIHFTSAVLIQSQQEHKKDNFPKTGQRQNFIFSFVSNPKFPELNDSVKKTMAKFPTTVLMDEAMYSIKLYNTVKEICGRGKHFFIL